MKIKPRDIAILAVVLVAGFALVFYTTRQYGGNAPQEEPKLVGQVNKTLPVNQATGKPVDVPNESAL